MSQKKPFLLMHECKVNSSATPQSEGLTLNEYKRVIITGASGWLGSVLTARLLHSDACLESIGVTRSRNPKDGYIDYETLLSGYLVQGDCVVHTAFCRKSEGSGLLKSLELSSKLFRECCERRVPVINISSQAVYGSAGGMEQNESSPLNPDYMYAFAKASSEVLLDAYTSLDPQCCATNFRLASLMGSSQGRSPVNVISKFITAALNGDPIKIVGGQQRFSFLDVEDAVDAIMCLLSVDPILWKKTYTITPDHQTGIVEVAKTVVEVVSAQTGKEPVPILIEPSDIRLNAGGSNLLAKLHLGWEPKTSFREIVEKMLDYQLSAR